MKKGTTLIVVGAAAALLAGAYYLLLSEDARRNVKEGFDEVGRAARTVAKTVDGSSETGDDLPNRQRTAAMWSAIGY